MVMIVALVAGAVATYQLEPIVALTLASPRLVPHAAVSVSDILPQAAGTESES